MAYESLIDALLAHESIANAISCDPLERNSEQDVICIMLDIIKAFAHNV